MLNLKAYAKINLTLEVISKRLDGYHEITSVFQTISLHDEIKLAHSNSISIECGFKQLDNTSNIAIEAASILKKYTGTNKGVKITLNKYIPISAGLGGGSSDAATVLLGLNQLWDLRLSNKQLVEVASELGSDVPFFLQKGTALVQGRGERVQRLANAKLGWIVLLSPPIHLKSKTSNLYSQLSSDHLTKGLLTHKLAGRIKGGGDVPPEFLFNVFEHVSSRAYDGIGMYQKIFKRIGGKEIHLAGSGPTLYCFVNSREVGTAMQLLLRHQYKLGSYLTTPWFPEARF